MALCSLSTGTTLPLEKGKLGDVFNDFGLGRDGVDAADGAACPAVGFARQAHGMAGGVVTCYQLHAHLVLLPYPAFM